MSNKAGQRCWGERRWRQSRSDHTAGGAGGGQLVEGGEAVREDVPSGLRRDGTHWGCQLG